MKKIYALLSAALIVGALSAQNQINFNFNHMLGEDSFAYDQACGVPGDYEIKIDRLEYYISEIVITHDGGQVTELEDVYLLVQPENQSVYELGMYDITSVEMVEFGLGVDPSMNNEDPGALDPEHPLAYQSPSMHWGWSSGYRFVAFEGQAGFGFLYNFQIHALGNANYGMVSLNYNNTNAVDGTVDIVIDADYTQFLIDVNVSNGAIVHSDTHPNAVQCLYNGRNSVFNSEAGPNSVYEFNTVEEIKLFPNPVEDNKVQWETSTEFDKAFVMDASGRILMEEVLGAGVNQLDLDESIESGIYFLRLEDNTGNSQVLRFKK